uniref:Uncharacterized protein n=1 Tax=Timema douglasi TaxID=61478 RepID=A0A7R8VEX7_TIMDO|nr:unnamed protein product [Timema douglasi]
MQVAFSEKNPASVTEDGVVTQQPRPGDNKVSVAETTLQVNEEDASDDEALGGAVTSQPTSAQHQSQPQAIFAMPAPGANENTSLNPSDKTTYTPGNMATGVREPGLGTAQQVAMKGLYKEALVM